MRSQGRGEHAMAEGARGGGRGSNGVIGRTGQIPVARHWSASVLVIQNPT